jgi:nuclear pore complex protein Nup205
MNIVYLFLFKKIQVKNKIVREVVDFVKGHQSLFDQVLRLEIAEADELRMEQINLVVGILSKVLFSSVISLFLKTSY